MQINLLNGGDHFPNGNDPLAIRYLLLKLS